MKKVLTIFSALAIFVFTLTGCESIGNKSTSMSVIYGATAVLSIFLLVGYCTLLKKRDGWFLLLFSSVFVVNAGYFCLSVSKSLDEALLANRISYLGSVILPLSMLMIILGVTNIKYNKWLICFLIPVTAFVFFVAASPGYLDIYYKTVTLKQINGVSVLIKEYGSWHHLYLVYLSAYFIAMMTVILYSKIKKKIESTVHSVILLIAVFVNISVWLLEQLVDIEFEFLSVSYIISELFLLGLLLIIEESARIKIEADNMKNLKDEKENFEIQNVDNTGSSAEFAAHCEYITQNLHTLTPTEQTIYKLYLDGKGTREVLKELDIKENTLKYHNKNIYSKLGVSSRKQLLEYAHAINKV